MCGRFLWELDSSVKMRRGVVGGTSRGGGRWEGEG